jgi:hypothetical protein
MHTRLSQILGQKEFKSLNTPSLEAAALDSLMLKEYQGICYWQFLQHRDILIYNLPVTVNVGAVISCSLGNELEDFVQIVFLLRIKSNLCVPRWKMAHWTIVDVTEDGWTRY